MSKKQLCSLCSTASIECKPLQTDFEWNEAYDITVKYIDPILLTQDENASPHHNSVLCQDCWFHINKFHAFQQTVINNRTMRDNKAILQSLLIKVEEAVIQENVSPQNATLKTSENNKGTLENACEEDESDRQTPRKIKSSKSCKEALEPILNQPVGDQQENSVYLDEEKNEVEHNSKTKEKIRKKSKSINAKATEEKRKIKNATRTTLTKNNEEKSNNERNLKRKNEEKQIEINVNLAKLSAETKTNLMEETKIVEKRRVNRKSLRDINAIITKWKPILTCDICNEEATNFEQLDSHFQQKHEASVYVKCCERKFYHRYLLANHFQLHLNPDFHKCDKCEKSYETKGALKTHERFAHESIDHLECNICSKIYTLKSSLVRHMITHSTTSKDFICSKCGRGYLTAKLLHIHVKYVHIGDRVCDQCGKTCHGSYAYKKHMMEHSGTKRRKDPCDVCGAKLSATNLKRHKEIYHNDGSSIHICSVCGKGAPSKYALQYHKKLAHKAEGKHKCTYCDKAFRRLITLREHIATHTGDYLYQCPHCSKKFKCSSHMYDHRKRHHPVEWEEARKNYPKCPKMSNNPVKKQTVIC